jgi:hypothetical protein
MFMLIFSLRVKLKAALKCMGGQYRKARIINLRTLRSLLNKSPYPAFIVKKMIYYTYLKKITCLVLKLPTGIADQQIIINLVFQFKTHPMKPTKRDGQIVSRLEKYCDQHNLSQKMAATRCDISQQDFNKLMNLKKKFSPEIIDRIMKGLGFNGLLDGIDLYDEYLPLPKRTMDKLKDIEETFRIVLAHQGNEIQISHTNLELKIFQLAQRVELLFNKFNGL